jgi:hypothetical protein
LINQQKSIAMNSFKYIKYLIIILIALSTIRVQVYSQNDFECLDYEETISPEGNEIFFEAWTFISGVNQFDPIYSIPK